MLVVGDPKTVEDYCGAGGVGQWIMRYSVMLQQSVIEAESDSTYSIELEALQAMLSDSQTWHLRR